MCAFKSIAYNLRSFPRIIRGPSGNAKLFQKSERLEHLFKSFPVIKLEVSNPINMDCSALPADHLIKLQALLANTGSGKLQRELSLRVNHEDTQLWMSRICTKHHFRKPRFPRPGFPKNSKVIGFTSATDSAAKMLEPHWIQDIVGIGLPKVNNLLTINSQEIIKKTLINSINSCSGRRNHPQNFRLKPIC